MEIAVNDSNSIIEVKSEMMECTTLCPNLLSCYGYSTIDVHHKKEECVVSVKEEKYEVPNVGIAPNDIKIKLDLSGNDDLSDTKTETFILKHTKSHTEETIQDDIDTRILQRKVFISPNEGNYKCDICPKSFAIKEFLQRHMKNHTGKINYKCEICNKYLTTRSNLLVHVKRHTGERNYKCDECNKCFTTKHHLSAHVKTHTAEKNYKCEDCNKCFARNTYLLQHVKTHNIERNYKCEVCDRRFLTKQYLSGHMKTHTGERNYKCHVCNKCFRTKQVQSRHVKIHTEERNYKCAVCNKSFTTKKYLSKHLKTHSRKALSEHMKTRTEESKKEQPFPNFPCIVTTSTTEEICDIDKDFIMKESDTSDNNCDAKERKPYRATYESRIDLAIKEDYLKSLHSEIQVKDELLIDT